MGRSRPDRLSSRPNAKSFFVTVLENDLKGKGSCFSKRQIDSLKSYDPDEDLEEAMKKGFDDIRAGREILFSPDFFIRYCLAKYVAKLDFPTLSLMYSINGVEFNSDSPATFLLRGSEFHLYESPLYGRLDDVIYRGRCEFIQ